jgi:manganese transport protein
VAGPVGALLFGIALLASGLASTIVSVYTGQVVLADFVRRPIAAPVRRLVAVVPAMVLLTFGLDATRALVLSQVVLCFTLPGTLVALVRMTASRDLMGARVNHALTTTVAAVATAVIVGMDAYLLVTMVTR